MARRKRGEEVCLQARLTLDTIATDANCLPIGLQRRGGLNYSYSSCDAFFALSWENKICFFTGWVAWSGIVGLRLLCPCFMIVNFLLPSMYLQRALGWDWVSRDWRPLDGRSVVFQCLGESIDTTADRWKIILLENREDDIDHFLALVLLCFSHVCVMYTKGVMRLGFLVRSYEP